MQSHKPAGQLRSEVNTDTLDFLIADAFAAQKTNLKRGRSFEPQLDDRSRLNEIITTLITLLSSDLLSRPPVPLAHLSRLSSNKTPEITKVGTDATHRDV